MDKGLVFWMLYIISIVFGGWGSYQAAPWWGWGNWVLIVLIGLLGWGIYGFAIH